MYCGVRACFKEGRHLPYLEKKNYRFLGYCLHRPNCDFQSFLTGAIGHFINFQTHNKSLKPP